MYRIELSAPIHWSNFQIHNGTTTKYVVDWRFEMSFQALEQILELGVEIQAIAPMMAVSWRN